ncbi:hypothetical protein ACJA88_001021 [Fusarium oxysporum]
MSDYDRKETLEEKASTSEVDLAGVNDPYAGLTEEEAREAEKKLLRKIDMKLVPWLCLLYLICFLDRTNIGNAKIAGLLDDVHMDTHHFNLTLTIFYISYAVFEPLANVLLKWSKPSIFIPAIMVLWGASMLGMGFVKTWDGLMAARWFLGVTEAGLFPGINYYLSCWYKRSEFGARAAWFFSAAALAGSFGGLLAAAIQKMDGVSGIAGWAWIFILEGLMTIVVGIISFWMVHDFPTDAKFITEEERARTYCGMLIYMGPLMPLYSFSVFLPTIIQNMAFTDKKAVVKNQLLSVPPYALAAVVTICVGMYSDRLNKRGIFNLCAAPVGMAGFTMLIASTNPAVQYTGCFLGALGIYPVIPITISWVANNVEGVYKRGITLGFVIGWGNLNGVVSSNVFINGPRFYPGHGTVLAYMFGGIFCGSLLMYVLLSRENKARLAGERDHLVEGKSEAEIHEMGDKRPDFLYTL